MGFFLLRKSDSSPLSNGQPEAKPPAAKWYGKLRRKDSRAFVSANAYDGAAASSRRQAPSVGTSASMQSMASADPTTATLAARLNDLASAHTDGLLNDDEYRILRQNLFERFGGSPEPAAAFGSQRTLREDRYSRSPLPFNSALPYNSPSYDAPNTSPPRPSPSRPSRPPPPSPNPSVLSSFSSSLRRAASRSSNHKSITSPTLTDSSASLFSFRTNTTITMAHPSMNASSHTLQSQASPPSLSIPSDLLSLSSRRSNAPSVTASQRSARPPPSSYVAPPQPPPPPRHTLPDNDEEKTAAQIRRDLADVEAEGRRVLEGFDALEASLLKQFDGPGPRAQPGTTNGDASRRSGSAGTGHNSQMDTIKPRKRSSLLDLSPLLPSALKSSVPPATPEPSARSARTGPPSAFASASRHAAVLVEPDPALTASLADVRKRRTDVRARYDARLAFLRAKLRGAELHEKLLR